MTGTTLARQEGKITASGQYRFRFSNRDRPDPVALDLVLIALADRCVARGWRQTEEDPVALLAEAHAALA